jgi:hypothetical protein
MEARISHHDAGGCLQSHSQLGALAWQARPPCAVLAQALRDQGIRTAGKRARADV